MPPVRCLECGDTKPLVDGRCAWRHGCEHRQFVAEARAHDLERELARFMPADLNHWSALPPAISDARGSWCPTPDPLYDWPWGIE